MKNPDLPTGTGAEHSARAQSRYRLAPEQEAAVRVDPPINLNVMECAAYLRCSPRKVRDLISSRRLRHARVGSRIIVRRQWVDEFLGA